MILLVMGVAGSGKTTIGRQLADALGWAYHEADDFHSAANKAKMGAGIPLTDEDRAPWLAAIHEGMARTAREGKSAVFTCSALKARYRDALLAGLEGVGLVFLHGDRELLLRRLQGRSEHYMKPDMLDSQLAILEPPDGALSLDVVAPPAELVAVIRGHFRI